MAEETPAVLSDQLSVRTYPTLAGSALVPDERGVWLLSGPSTFYLAENRRPGVRCYPVIRLVSYSASRLADYPAWQLAELERQQQPRMIVTVASNKGGVGKTTTAIHLAAYLQQFAPTLLVDNDPNRNSIGWAARSQNRLPFRVVDMNQSLKVGRHYEHIIFDTKARADRDELQTLAQGCDLLVVPTTPDAMAIETLMSTVDILRSFAVAQFRILITIIPPYPERDGEDARAMLQAYGYPLFAAGIRQAKGFKTAALRGLLINQLKGPRATLCWDDYAKVGAELVA